MQVEQAYYDSPDFAVTSQSSYKTNDAISDENKRLYLYLPVSDEKKATAQYTDQGTSYDYYGTTTADGNGWLKRGGMLTLTGPLERGEAEPIVGSTFAVMVTENPNLKEGTAVRFTVESVNGDAIVVNGASEDVAAEGDPAQISLTANDKTEYTVTAETQDLASDLYWDMKGTYKSAITREAAELTITGDPSKIYDGTAVDDPTVEHNSDALDVAFTYYEKDGISLVNNDGSAPKDAGTYYVMASIDATANYTGADSAKKEFTIEERPFTMELEAAGIKDGEGNTTTKVSVTVTAFGAVAGESIGGKVTVTGIPESGTASGESVDAVFGVVNEDGTATATVAFDGVAGDDYQVTAVWTAGEKSNYRCIDTPSKTYHKNLADREITMSLEGQAIQDNTITVTYGKTGIPDKNWGDVLELIASAADGKNTNNDSYSYEVVHDGIKELYPKAKATIEVGQTNTGTADADLVYHNAGEAIIKVMLQDTGAEGSQLYNDAVTYVHIKIQPAEVNVDSFAYTGTKPDAVPTETKEAVYGSVDQLQYGISCTETSGLVEKELLKKIENALTPVALDEKTGVGEYTIDIQKTGSADIEITGSELRNYRLAVTKGKVRVIPAPLQVSVDNQTIKYGFGANKQYTYKIEDLMEWDSPVNVIESAGLKEALFYYTPAGYSNDSNPYVDHITIKKGPAADNYTWQDNGGTIEYGDLTVEKGRLTIEASIASKVYDGAAVSPAISLKPITAGTIQREDMADPQDPEVTYYRITEHADGTKSSVRVVGNDLAEYESGKYAPVNAGEYIAKIKAGDTNYAETQVEVSFCILKALSEPDTPVVDDIRMKDGLRLQDVAISVPIPDNGRPAGGTWKWKNPEQKLEPGSVSAFAIYTPQGSDVNNYHPAVKLLRFNVYELEKGRIVFSEDPSKVYDGRAVSDPAVELNTDAKSVRYTYYNISDDKTNPVKLDQAPVDAGKYSVVASVAATEHYSSAQAEMEFSIQKRPVTLQLTAAEEAIPNSSQVSVVMTVTVLDAAVINDTEKAVIQLKADRFDDSEETRILLEKSVEQVNGQYTATFTFTRLADSDYRITAEFPETSNHHYAKVQQNFDAAIGERTVNVYDADLYDADDPDSNSALSSIEKKYGDAAMTIIAVPSTYDTDHAVPSADEYAFEIVSDSLGDTIELDKATEHEDQRTLTFKNAGRAVIKVTVTNSDFASEAVTYLTVIVTPAAVTVESYAYAKGTEADERTVVKYGEMDTLDFGVKYADGSARPDGLLNALKAVPLDKTTGVGIHTIDMIRKNISDAEKALLRNYTADCTLGTLEVTKADLSVAIGNSRTTYGIEWEYDYTFGEDGLAEWDRAKDVIKISDIGLQKDGQAVEKIPFPAPGDYEIIGVAATDNPNYNITGIDAADATLTIDKGDTNIDIRALSKTYDGAPVDIRNAVQPVLSQNITLSMVENPLQYADVSYEKWNGLLNGGWESLSEPPTNAGTYGAKVVIKDNPYYEEKEEERRFTIYKAQYPINTPDLPDMQMRDGLKLDHQQLPEGWKWMNPDQPLSVGEIQAYAVYMLTDVESINYIQPDPVLLTFNVYEEPAAGEDDAVEPNDPTTSDDPDKSEEFDEKPSTGDDADLMLWFLMLVTSGTIGAVMYGFRKRKD